MPATTTVVSATNPAFDAKGKPLPVGAEYWNISRHKDHHDVFYCNHKDSNCHRMEPVFDGNKNHIGWYCILGHGPLMP